jgi:hypothetical protein
MRIMVVPKDSITRSRKYSHLHHCRQAALKTLRERVFILQDLHDEPASIHPEGMKNFPINKKLIPTKLRADRS